MLPGFYRHNYNLLFTDMKRFLTISVAALCSFSFLSLFARAAWPLELMTHFRPHYFLLLTLLSSALLAIPAYRPAYKTALCGLLFAGLNAALAWHYLLPATLPSTDRPTLKLLSSNLNFSNQRTDLVAQLINDEQPDVVVLSEFTYTHQHQLHGLLTSFRHHWLQPRSDGFGIALLSNIPISKHSVIQLANVQTPQIEVDLLWSGKTIRLLGLHLLSPEIPAGARGRNLQIKALIKRLNSATSIPQILLGDFNITPWSPYYADLLDSTGLLNTAAFASWPSVLGPLGIPIDHCLHTPELITDSKRRGPNVHSDHYPLIVELAWNSFPAKTTTNSSP